MTTAVRIGIIGDYQPTSVTHQATVMALHHAADRLSLPLEATWLPTTALEPLPDDALETYDALWCAPGSPYHSMNGALNAIRWAREHDRPFLGTCAEHRFFLGTLFVPQCTSTKDCPHPLIVAYVEEASRFHESRSRNDVSVTERASPACSMPAY